MVFSIVFGVVAGVLLALGGLWWLLRTWAQQPDLAIPPPQAPGSGVVVGYMLMLFWGMALGLLVGFLCWGT